MPVKTATIKNKKVVVKKPKVASRPSTTKTTKKVSSVAKPLPVAEVLSATEIGITIESEENSVVNGKEKYYEAVGRRKRAIARVRLFTKKSSDQEPPNGRALISVNKKPYYEYFRDEELRGSVDAPLKKLKSLVRFKVTVLVKGGGITGQAEAIRHGLSRALVLFDENFSKKFRKAGYLTRDSREKERRKYGLKKARKAPRWSKR